MGFQIGVIVDSFRLPIREGIRKAHEIGAEGIQIYAVDGAMHPDKLNLEERKELLRYIRSFGLKVSALCGDPGGGFMDRDTNRDKIRLSKKIIDLALDLECQIVTTHIGVIPHDVDSERYKIMAEACEELGDYAKNMNASFAIETGPEPSAVLKEFLDRLHTSGVKVNFDPANLVMVIGEDPAEAVNNLKEYIVHTHAKDGRMITKYDPEELYIRHTRSWEQAFIETPLGEGNVNFRQYLKALRDINYQGFLTIEREVGENPENDILRAVNFLRRLI
ncbi:MAG: sugar phosphate isomerase/epimerase [Clostridia bacterium]|nr:sugar phosphate isomerase/epimerase [Clostridia bacterium]